MYTTRNNNTASLSASPRSDALSPDNLLGPQRSQPSARSTERTTSTGSDVLEQVPNSPSLSVISSRTVQSPDGEVFAGHIKGLSLNSPDRTSTPSHRSMSGDHPRETANVTPAKRSPRAFSILQVKAAQNAETSDVPSSPSSALGIHLIPSRRSSLRQSSIDGLRTRKSRRESKRFSASSRELKHMEIEPGLVEEDYSAMRRIRELQDAKEKRQREWQRESRHREKQKRNSMPSPKLLQGQTPDRSTRPVVGVLMEVADKENSQVTSIAPKQIRPAISQSFSDSRLELPKRFAPATAEPWSRKTSSDTAQATALRHQRGLSSTIKRSVTMNSTFVSPTESAQNLIGEEVDAFLASPRFTQKIRHPRTGRIIAFSEVGDPKGFPVICCVGMGLTRYVTAFYDELAKSLRLRLITPDRPGVGESGPCSDGRGTPLGWADDIYVLCSALEVDKFSLLAHSAGAIYALATTLRLPQHVRGQIHLLSPWIPPSQMSSIASSKLSAQAAEIPFGQKVLSVLPTSFLRIANASFMSATSASISPRSRTKRKSGVAPVEPSPIQDAACEMESYVLAPSTDSHGHRTVSSSLAETCISTEPHGSTLTIPPTIPVNIGPTSSSSSSTSLNISPDQRRRIHNETLTHRIWDLATTHANPATDLVVCLERRGPIGFKYTDVARGVIIYHGEDDTRVPVDTVKSLGHAMKRAEVRVLPGEGHGLMASATVMSNVLGEIEREWSTYDRVVSGNNHESTPPAG